MKPGSPGLRGRRALGAFGEEQAAIYLRSQGLTILARNWRCSLGELDLIARSETTLVFVEVRTRRSTAYGSPEESLTGAKRARLISLAYAYLAELPAAPPAWQIDLVAVELGPGGSMQLRHWPSAIEEG